MSYKVVLAAMEVGIGPWVRSTGKEMGVRITHLLPGELLNVQFRHTAFTEHVQQYTEPGEFPWPRIDSPVAYRFEKLSPNGDSAPTIVEVKYP